MTKLEDTLYCSVWSGPEATHGLAVWVVFVLLPIALGPILTTLLEILYSLAKRCSSTQVQGEYLTYNPREGPSPLLLGSFPGWRGGQTLMLLTMRSP